jgi:phosphoribosylanthranilate isomerase
MRIKVCGLTRPQDVEAAVAAGVDALGFVTWPRSPRAVSVDQLRLLVRAVPHSWRRCVRSCWPGG